MREPTTEAGRKLASASRNWYTFDGLPVSTPGMKHAIRAIEQEIEPHDWVIDPHKVHAHIGHGIVIDTYADQNLVIECDDCDEVIADIDYADASDE